MNEIWKDIEDYEGLYQISNYGRVKSLGRTIIDSIGRKKVVSERVLKSFKDSKTYLNAYLNVDLFKNNKKQTNKVHRLVALHFIIKPEDWQHIEENEYNGYTVNHKDGNKLNNHVENLEWLTQSDNSKHSIQNGFHKNSLDMIENKKIKVLCKELNKEFESLNDASNWFRLNSKYKKASTGTISAAINKKNRTAFGFNWVRVGEEMNI